MFGIGSMELLVILVVALIVLGPKNLPKMAQTIGKAMGQFQKVSREFQRTINTEIALEEEQEKKEKEKKEQAKKEEGQKKQAEQAKTAETVGPAQNSAPAHNPAANQNQEQEAKNA